MSFRVGQKVVCVNAGGCDLIANGEIYTVSGVGLAPLTRLPMLWLGEIERVNEYTGMYASRFRPIVERKTDISALKALLVPGAKIRETAE